MTNGNRRDFLSASALIMGPVLAPGLASSIAKAQAIPASNRTGTLMDVEHVVILMQENRSFDHYFGTLAGVRGFSDPNPAPIGTDRTVWHQPDARGLPAMPFRFDVNNSTFPVMKSLPHDYETGHEAWNRGRYDQWWKAKGPLTMGYLTREDIPFHHALADAFTLCDAYHCSIHSSTCPNRLFMLTGNNDPFNKGGGGPVLANNNITQVPEGVDIYQPGWVTYAERLEQAGIDWRAYRQGIDPYSDDDSDGGMNLLVAFAKFIDAKPGDALYERGVSARRLSQLKADVLADKLPQVSWLFPPRLFCEHPKWPPAYGPGYISRILDALTANPAVWSKTAFFITYDENDGFFDHMVPPVAPHDASQGLSTVDTSGEFNPLDQTPYGLGPRVPLLAISPWSRGGFVCSEVFDHTSLLRFLEARFNVRADGVTPWRRAVCGDLTSAFNFKTPNSNMPASVERIDANTEMTTNKQFKAYRETILKRPAPIAIAGLALPKQEPGRRPLRPLNYELAVRESFHGGTIALAFHNEGGIGAHFQVYDQRQPDAFPKRYTVEAGKTLSDHWPLEAGVYALTIHGPNGFVQKLDGHATDDLTIAISGEGAKRSLYFQLAAAAQAPRTVEIKLPHDDKPIRLQLPVGKSYSIPLATLSRDNWHAVEISSGALRRSFHGQLDASAGGLSDPLLSV